MITPIRQRTAAFTAALLVCATPVVLALHAAAAEVTLTPVEAPQPLIDGVDQDVENNTGEGVSTRSNDNPITFAAEDDSTLGAGESIIYRLYGYEMTYPAEDCASYSVQVEMTVTADGPQVGTGDNMIMGVLDADHEALAGSSHTSPSGVDESKSLSEEFGATADQLRTGLLIAFGATTHQDGIESGYTFGTPDVTVTEDLSGCDLDSDGVADDEDPDNSDPCVPDDLTDACVESLNETATTTTTTAAPEATTTTVAPVAPTADQRYSPAPLRPTG